ncbi:expansin EXLX1 family cellulose-binding protein [Kitasatospora sp. NBC_01287]|uniref:expansin EXLX1 family cellulose-binding protein n=1 Tax=Kitasatospora sp. NBC_01287 TaxID=2903573 RepID=UPI002255979E|nr:expansin EXLX1 family cellulose-binding protein [Kitasatospora sp. NBC_01287]MCX4744727.1 expansin EXLX1 family cellulose-binding protein [Kitasatospora sp. NBC_01287]
MKAMKHAARRPWHRHGPARGVPLALLAVGVLVCLVVTFLVGGGGDSGRPVVGAAARTTEPGVSVPPTAQAAASAASAGADAPATVTSSVPASATPSPAPSASPTRTQVPATPVAPTASASGSAGAVSASGSAGVAPAAATLAGRIKPGVTNQGVATAYAAGDGNGSCLYGPSDDLMIAAMNYTDYESSKACGAYVSVRTASGAAITVRIVNDCPAPCAPGQLDLSQQAFARLADLSVGRLPITWTLLSPDTAGTVSIRYKTGSSKWWCGIQVIGHRNPLAELEVRGAGGWQQLPRSDFNYFLSTDGTGCGGEIRLTDIYGQQLTVDGIIVQPDVVQPTGAQFARH